MIVVDTSALVAVLAEQPRVPGLSERLAADGDLHAPHLVDVEFLHALRALTQSRALDENRAQDARADFAELSIRRYPHEPLVDRAWELRHNVSAYDAMFVVLAELLEVPLVTCDAKLAGAPVPGVKIELHR